MKIRALILILSLLSLLFCFAACDTPIEECVHIESDWITDAEPSLDAEGARHTECMLCGETISTDSIPELYLSEEEIIGKLEAAVIKVICYDYDGVTVMSQGSGFFIDSDGTFITNAHVVTGCFYIKVQNCLGEVYTADTVYKFNNTSSDYAICKANVSSTAYVEFSANAEVGDTVYALGYPNDADELTVTSGSLTSTATYNSGRYYYASTALISRGSSGGLLADDKGRAIGITSGEFKQSDFAAIRYPDFKDGMDIKEGEALSPIDQFHTTTAVDFSDESIEEYFKILLHTSTSEDGTVSYWLAVQLKDKYQYAKIVMLSDAISATVEIKTERGDNIDTQYLTFTFADRGAMSDGIQQYTSVEYPDYTSQDVSYTVTFSAAIGEVIIYDI